MNQAASVTVSEVATPFGPLRVRATAAGIVSIELPPFPAGPPAHATPPDSTPEDNHALHAEAARQLQAYFAGELRSFRLPLAPAGTPFQREVWAALVRIPFGETRSYLQIATALGNPAATRAVGAANGKNPIAVVVPCHRVIGASGALTGYAGGLSAKAWLLRHEGVDGAGEQLSLLG